MNDGISDHSMRGAQALVDAAVEHGARVTISEGDFGYRAFLQKRVDGQMLSMLSVGRTQREAIWSLGMRLLSDRACRVFLELKQIEEVLARHAATGEGGAVIHTPPD